MFYSYDLLCRRKNGKFSTLWLAATKHTKKLNKCLYMKVNIPATCSEILNVLNTQNAMRRGEDRQRYSLYLSAMLLNGLCHIYRQQVIYFMQHITITWQSLNSKATLLDKAEKARHERPDDEDSDDDSNGPPRPPKKPRKRTNKKKTSLPIESGEDLENELDQVLAENTNALEREILQPNGIDNFLLVEPNVPTELTEERPDDFFGTLDNPLLDRMIEGNFLFPNNDGDTLLEELDGPALIQALNAADAAVTLNEIVSQNTTTEQENVDVNRQIVDGRRQVVNGNEQVVDDNQQVVDDNQQVVDNNQQVADDNQQVVDDNQQVVEDNRQENSLAPLEQEPMDVVTENVADQLAETIVLTPVNDQQTEIPEHQVRSTVDQIIEDVIANALQDQSRIEEPNDEPPRKRLRKWKKGIVAEEKNHFTIQEILERARDRKIIKKRQRCVDWRDNCLNFSLRRSKSLQWVRLLDEPHLPLVNPELEDYFGTDFLVPEIYDQNLSDTARRERSSILSSSSRSRTSEHPSVLNATTGAASLDNTEVPLPRISLVEENVSTGGVVPIQQQNVPELPSLDEEILPEETRPSLHEEVLPEENRPNVEEVAETEIVQNERGESQILPDIPLEELMPMEIENVDNVPVENVDETNVRPANERQANNLSQESIISTCSQDTNTVLSTLQEKWGDLNDYVTFDELCPVGVTSKKKAVKVFYVLLVLHKMKKVQLHQVSHHVINIYKC